MTNDVDDIDRRPRDPIPESVRRPLASIFQWGGWLGSLAICIWATVEYNPAKGQFAPQWVGFLFIALIGVAMAGTTARSRMRLTDAIVHAFRAGRLTAGDDFGSKSETSERSDST
jgi:hypothetical protein